ncbi:HAD family hydrolase [bacterium]|nr:HAD family hydrolase [candidate division CSSED10-310 bacterium]
MDFNGIKAVYFDMGGVLMDVSDDYSREAAVRHALDGPIVREFLGSEFQIEGYIEFTDAMIAARNGSDYLQEDAYRQERVEFEKYLGKQVPFSVFQEKFWRQIDFMTSCFILKPMVRETLQTIQDRGLIIGLISNVFHPAIIYKQMFTKWEIIDYFNPLLFSSEFRFKKPHRAIFDYALSWHPGLTGSDVVFVGDTWHIDVAGALDAGFKPVWINPGYQDDARDGVPVIRDISAIPTLLNLRELSVI